MTLQYGEWRLASSQNKKISPVCEPSPAYGSLTSSSSSTARDLAQKDWDAAIAQFQTVAEDVLYATPHFPLTNMGIAYYNKKDYVSAQKHYQDALDLQPEF